MEGWIVLGLILIVIAYFFGRIGFAFEEDKEQSEYAKTNVAIDKAIEIGMGKRTNTILQSAFFKLANVMPIDEAVDFMKAAAKKSYGKKGDAVVEMNYKAIDAGVDAVHKVC